MKTQTIRKIATSVIAVFIALSSGFTQTHTKEPLGLKETALAFIKAMNVLDIKTARTYASDSARPAFDKMLEELKSMTPEQKKELNNEVAKRRKTSINIKEIIEQGDKATITFTTSDQKTKVDTLPMLKQHGKWLADIRF